MFILVGVLLDEVYVVYDVFKWGGGKVDGWKVDLFDIFGFIFFDGFLIFFVSIDDFGYV